MESVIHLLNNWGQVFILISTHEIDIKHAELVSHRKEKTV